jgi:hypothetical protein
VSIFKDGFEVLPGMDGSFTVLRGAYLSRGGTRGEIWGFTNLRDLMVWLQQQAAGTSPSTAGTSNSEQPTATTSIDHMAAVRESAGRP